MGVKTRKSGWQKKIYLDEEKLKKLYIDKGMSLQAIANYFKCKTKEYGYCKKRTK